MPTVELRLAPLPAHVRTARLVAAALARRAGVDENVIDEVRLAVGEACTRAVSLHASYAPTAEVVVELTDSEKQFVVAVRDRGPHAVPAAVVPDLNDVESLDLPPGFGLAIVAGLVDDLEVLPGDPGTVVRMTWSVTP